MQRSVLARGLPSRACEVGRPCHRLYARRERLSKVLRETMCQAEIIRKAGEAAETKAIAEAALDDLRHSWDVLAELTGAITRLDTRLEDCIIEYDYITLEDQEVLYAEREFDL